MPNTIYTSEKVLPYVYYGVHKITSQFYIGYRSANKRPSHLDLGFHYFTSSVEIEKLGFNNFDWTIIAEFFSPETGGDDAYDFEQDLILEHWYNPLKLNKHCQRNGKWSTVGTKHTETSKQKMRKPKSNTEKMTIAQLNRTQEHQDKLSEANRGKIASEETRQKLSDVHKGKPKSEETKQKMSQPRTKEHKDNISKGLRNYTRTEEHQQNIANNNMSKVKTSCPHCRKEGGYMIMKRWHFDNCKFKETPFHSEQEPKEENRQSTHDSRD